MKFEDAFKGLVVSITAATSIVTGSMVGKEAILAGMTPAEAASISTAVSISEMDDDAISGLQEAEDRKEQAQEIQDAKPLYGQRPLPGEGGKRSFDVDAVRDVMRTGPGQAYFWSGTNSFARPEDMSEAEYRAYSKDFGGAARAAEIAGQRGGTTLEMKMDAHKQELIWAGFPYDQEKDAFKWDPSDPENGKAWQDISEAFAQGAQGDVHVVYGSDSNGIAYDQDGNPTGEYRSIWDEKERDALKSNEKVTSITAIDPMTQEEEKIYNRAEEAKKENKTAGQKEPDKVNDENKDGGQKKVDETSSEGSDGGQKKVDETSSEGSDVGQKKVDEPSSEGSDVGQKKVDEPSSEGSDVGQKKVDEPSSEGSDGGQKKADETSSEGNDGGQKKVDETSSEDSDGGQKKADEPSSEDSDGGQKKVDETSSEGSDAGQKKVDEISDEDNDTGKKETDRINQNDENKDQDNPRQKEYNDFSEKNDQNPNQKDHLNEGNPAENKENGKPENTEDQSEKKAEDSEGDTDNKKESEQGNFSDVESEKESEKGDHQEPSSPEHTERNDSGDKNIK